MVTTQMAMALRGVSVASMASASPPPFSSRLLSPDSDENDGMVFLPRASPFVTTFCVCLYVLLALVAASRACCVSSSSSSSASSSSSSSSAAATSSTSLLRRRADALKRQQTFQRLLVLFALLRALSLVLSSAATRGLVNRLALCVFFSLVLFQVLFWIDIANPKLSTRSRRIWNTFLAANALFYAVVLGLFWLQLRESERPERATRTRMEQMERRRLWDLLPVLLIALGSLAASLGLLYSTCKTRRRVGRVLRQLMTHSLPQRLNDRVQAKLQRALRVTNAIMGVCSVVFLLRTVLYIQRPFSHQECGAIRDPNACLLIGYGLPELLPCALFLVLMWEVEPQLELQAGRRKSSINVVAVARASETTPLLQPLGMAAAATPHSVELTVDVSELHPHLNLNLNLSRNSVNQSKTPTQRASPLSSGLGGNVIAAARRRLRRVLEESFGMRSEEEGGEDEVEENKQPKRVARQRTSGQSVVSPSPSASRSSSDRRDPADETVDASRSRESSGTSTAARSEETQTAAVAVWVSFQCFRLKLPSTSEPAVVLVVHESDNALSRGETEIGRTEVAYSADPSFRVMLPVLVRAARVLRVSVFAVTRANALHDLNAQWLIGSALVPLGAYLSSTAPSGAMVVVPGTASVHELRSLLSRTHAAGELVVRCEAPLVSSSSTSSSSYDSTHVETTKRMQRITRAFVYQPTTDHATGSGVMSPKSSSHRCKLLVEEELIESVFTWEMPYQLLQLILSDLLVQLDVLKRALTVDGELDGEQEDKQDPNENGSKTATVTATTSNPTRVTSASSVGMLSEMIMQIQGDAMARKSKKWGDELVAKMESYIDDVEAAILRYEQANLGGLTFKPSTMKADSGLSFLALNLHQQLLSVGNAVTASTRDVHVSDYTTTSANRTSASTGTGGGGGGVMTTVFSASARRCGDPQHYVQLIDSSAVAVETSSSSPSLRIMEAEHGRRNASGHSMFDDSASDDGDDDEEADGHNEMKGATQPQRPQEDDEAPRSRTPEPFEALRRRVISFDSAETIVMNLHVAGSGGSGDSCGGGAAGSAKSVVPVSREQRQLAETIVALGIENVLVVDGGVQEAEQEPDAFSSGSNSVSSSSHPSRVAGRGLGLRETTRVARSSFDVAAREPHGSLTTGECEPFTNHEMYGTTTVGAFAAHVYGFRHGGIRQLRTALTKLSERMDRESQRVGVGAELTVEALEREYVELKWQIDRRLEVTFCQAMSALATCFQQTLYVHLHERGCASGSSSSSASSGVARVRGLAYLEQLAEIGFLFSVESLLSTYSKEAGMLGDMEAAVRELARVRIKLRPVQSPRAAQFRVAVTSGPHGLTMELPLIVVPPARHKDRTMHRVLGQDAATGAVYVALATPQQWTRARQVFRRAIAVVPVLFSQGMNEMQTVANTVGKNALQKEINSENLGVLERQVDAFVAWRRRRRRRRTRSRSTTPPAEEEDDEEDDGEPREEEEDEDEDGDLLRRLAGLRSQLRDHIQRADRGKHMDILTLSSAIARLLGGGRVTCCKSAKDRTAMAVTLEEASLLVHAHGLRSSEKELFTALLRTYGVRRENARKNIGQAQYCFSALQNFLLPADYQCPPGTGGGGSTLS